MKNVSNEILKEINESYYPRVNRAQADYDKWSTVLSYKNKILGNIKEVVDKINSNELKDIDAISKELQDIIKRNS